MNRGPGTLRTFFIVLGSSWFSLILNVLRVLVLPGKLHDSGLGQVTLAISFTGFFGVFTALGVSTYLVRAVARDDELTDRYLTNALILRLVMSLAVLGLVIGVAGLFGYTPETQHVIFILGIQMVIFTISNVFESGLQALGMMSWRAIATAIGQVTATFVGVGLLLGGADAVLYAWSLPLGTAIQFGIVLSYYFRNHPIKWTFDTGIMRALLIGGMPLFLWSFLQSAYGQIDATLLSLFANVKVVGWFGAASQITNMLVMIPGAVIAVALPVLCEMYVRPGSDFDRTSNRTMITTLLVMFPLGAGLAVAAPDILRVLPYPPEFANATIPLMLMALALPVTGAMMVLATLAVAIGQEKEWLKISAFAVVIFPPLYIVLIWFFQTRFGNGAIGAASANFTGETILLIWAWFVLPKRLRQREVVRRGAQIAALSGVMVAAVALLQLAGMPLFVYVPVGAVIYIAGAWLMHLVTPDDIQQVRGAVLRKAGRRAQPVPSES